MSKIKINLISQEASFDYLIPKLRKKIKLTAYLCLFLLIVGLILSFGLFFNFKSQINTFAGKITQTGEKIKSETVKEGNLVLIKNRSKLISQIFTNRSGAINALTILEKILPADISFNKVETDTKGKLKITLVSKNSSVLNTFSNSVSAEEFKKSLKYLGFSLVSLKNDKTYEVVLEMTKDVINN